MNMPYFVYILRCADGSLYTGISNDLERRLRVHNSGRGAVCVRLRRPAHLVWYTYAGTCSYAMQLEYHIKGYTHGQKEQLIAGTYKPDFFAEAEKRMTKKRKRKKGKFIARKTLPGLSIGRGAGRLFHL